jgi:uncharacterized SAM-binding protein YcdF (DUF218 family)
MVAALKSLLGYWLMPLPFCVAVMLAGLVMLRCRCCARSGRIVFGGGFVLLLLFGNGYVSRWLIHPLETKYAAVPELVAGAPVPAPLAACRFVVVLGGGNGDGPGVSANNLLSASARARLVEGVRLLRVLPDAKLIVSGPAQGRRDSHATVMGRTAIALGLAPERIVTIDEARDTEAEAQAVRRRVQDAPIALVTSAWHLPRALALFRKAGVNTLPCPADFTAHARDPFQFEDIFWRTSALERSTYAVRERLGYLWSWLRGRV